MDSVSAVSSVLEKSHVRWETQWSEGLQIGDKFDVGKPSPALLKEIAEGRVPTGTALVPGCGRGYDVYALAAADRVATGMELAPTAVKSARAFAGSTDCTCSFLDNGMPALSPRDTPSSTALISHHSPFSQLISSLETFST